MKFVPVLLSLVLSVVFVTEAMAREQSIRSWYPLLHGLATERALDWQRIALERSDDGVIRIEVEAKARLFEFTPLILVAPGPVELKRSEGGRRFVTATAPAAAPEVASFATAVAAVSKVLDEVAPPHRLKLRGPITNSLSLTVTVEAATAATVLPADLAPYCDSLHAFRSQRHTAVTLHLTLPISGRAVTQGQPSLSSVLPQAEIELLDTGLQSFRYLTPELSIGLASLVTLVETMPNRLVQLECAQSPAGTKLSGTLYQ